MRYHEKNCLVSLTTWLVLLSLQIHTQAGPVKRSSRMIREVYPEIEPEKDVSQAQVCIVGDVVYGMDEMVPAEQPCLKCKCQPPGVQCETTRCVKKPGCRAIHRPNKCCPDYQCECEHNGRTYANGERLETSPGGECKVCYCRGGEVQCAEVTCYIRTDCEGRTVPGQCCPKYDHCPPKEPFLERSLSTQTDANGTFLMTTQNTYRFTDLSKQYKENLDDNKIPVDKIEKVDKGTQTDFTSEPYLMPVVPDDSPKVVVQEIIPEIELVPVTTQIDEEPHGHLIIEETTEAKNQVSNHSGAVLPQEINDLVTVDSDTEPSEVSEIYQHPPPVLRIGDKLLFLKKGELVPEKDVSTPIPVITIIGAEGLQRGFEESGEVHEIYSDQSNSSKEYENQSNDLEASGTSSSHILSLVKFRKKINEPRTAEVEISTEPTLVTTTTTTTDGGEGDLENFDFNTTSDLDNVTMEEESTTSPLISTTEDFLNSTEPVTKTAKTTKSEEDGMDQNPAYPPIPDDMSPQAQSETIEQEPDISSPMNETKQKILPEILEMRNNKTIPQNSTNWEWLKNESLINENAALPEEILNTTYYGDFEETSTTESGGEFSTKITTDAKLGKFENEQTPGDLEKTPEGSPESLEDVTIESSKELTTTKNTPPSLMSNENASVDIPKNTSPESAYALEKVEILSNLEESDEIGNNGEEFKDDPIKESSTKILPADVEIFDTKVPLKNTSEETTPRTGGDYERKTKEKPERIIKETTKHYYKRQNSAEDEAREVFRQLDDELKGANTQRSLSKAEEEKEAERIFKELLQETTSAGEERKMNSPQTRNEESEILQRVSDAIAKFQLRDTKQSLDTSILGILRDFFASQYRSYEKNRK